MVESLPHICLLPLSEIIKILQRGRKWKCRNVVPYKKTADFFFSPFLSLADLWVVTILLSLPET